MVKLRYFTKEEIDFVSFGCDNGFERMQEKVLIQLDELRHAIGFPLSPTCAFRTKEYDLAKGRSGKSDHCYGRGIDIYINDLAHGLHIQSVAVKFGFNSFGINLKRKFIHIGMRDLQENEFKTWNY